MRIWDINPGYLNRQSLLGEHRELHGVVAIIQHNKKGYSKHPETLRWVGHGWALRQRHRQLVAEMQLRGYHDNSPVTLRSAKNIWPACFIDDPHQQFEILKQKYLLKEQGRIPLPASAQQLWSQHKYSVLARNVALYKKLGKEVAQIKPRADFSALAMRLTQVLRVAPSAGGIRNALQHMWGYVDNVTLDQQAELRLQTTNKSQVASWTMKTLLAEIQKRAVASGDKYLLASTALSELGAWY